MKPQSLERKLTAITDGQASLNTLSDGELIRRFDSSFTSYQSCIGAYNGQTTKYREFHTPSQIKQRVARQRQAPLVLAQWRTILTAIMDEMRTRPQIVQTGILDDVRVSVDRQHQLEAAVVANL